MQLTFVLLRGGLLEKKPVTLWRSTLPDQMYGESCSLQWGCNGWLWVVGTSSGEIVMARRDDGEFRFSSDYGSCRDAWYQILLSLLPAEIAASCRPENWLNSLSLINWCTRFSSDARDLLWFFFLWKARRVCCSTWTNFLRFHCVFDLLVNFARNIAGSGE